MRKWLSTRFREIDQKNFLFQLDNKFLRAGKCHLFFLIPWHLGYIALLSKQVEIFVFVVKSLSRARLFATPWTITCQAPLFFTISWSLFKFMSIELVMLSNHLILCHPLLLLPSIFPSIKVSLNKYMLFEVLHVYLAYIARKGICQ